MRHITTLVAALLLSVAGYTAEFTTDGFDYPVDFDSYVTTQEFLTPGPCGGGLGVVFHPGDDYDAPGDSTGEPVLSAGDGIIAFAEEGYNNGYGNLVVVQHLGQFHLPDSDGHDSGEVVINPQTVYAHLDSISVNHRTGLLWQIGETILRGEEVGDLGGTPNYTPHLHFEVRRTHLDSLDFYPCTRDRLWVEKRYTYPAQFINLNRPDPSSPNVILSDDFNGEEVGEDWFYGGVRVLQSGGIVKVETAATDNGGILVSQWFDVNPNNPLTLHRRVKVKYGRSHSSMPLVFDWEGRPQDQFGVYYMKYSYQMSGCITNSFFLFREEGRAHKCNTESGQLSNKVSPPLTPFWNEWFEEKIVYHPDTGDAEYYRNDVLLMNWNFRSQHTSRPRMRIMVNAWGWWTGHYHYMDWLEVTN